MNDVRRDRKQFSDELRHRYPIVAGSMPAVSVGPGWWGIVEDTLKSLERLAESQQNAGELSVAVCAMEQKLGSLRTEVSHGTLACDFIVEAAEEKSLTTCEVCGAPGRLRDEREWWETLCGIHA